MTAKEAYKKNQTEIKKSISAINKYLIKHSKKFEKQPNNWGFVGDLTYIKETLKNIIK
jgi:hypothetical protein